MLAITPTLLDVYKTLPDIISGFRDLASQCRDLVYDKDNTTISLDDEKEHIRSKDVLEKGLSRKYQRDGNPGPTLYAGVSKNSGVLLSAEFQVLNESTQACTKRAIAMAVGNSQDFDSIGLDGAIVSADRGINQPSLLYQLVDKGAKVSGTVPRSRGSDQAFASFSSRAAMIAPTAVHGAHDILEYGTRSSYWVKKGNLYYLAVRQGHGGSIVYLTTSDLELGPGTYILERASIHHHRVCHVYQRDGSIDPNPLNFTNSDDGCLNFFKVSRKLRFLTERQAEAMWFLLRDFRLTSTVSRKVLMTIRHNVIRRTDDSVNDIRMHDLLGNLADLLMLGEGAEQEVGPLDFNFPNYQRLNVDALKKACKSLGMTGYSKLNRDRLLISIAERLHYLQQNPTEMPTHSSLDAVHKAFFECWFLEPTNPSPAMVEGAANEKKVIQGIAKFFLQNLPASGNCPYVQEIATTGLILNSTIDYVATSVDGLLCMRSAEDEDSKMYGSIEIKTHVASGNQSHLIHSLASKYGNICATVVSHNIAMYTDVLNEFYQNFGFDEKKTVPIAEVIPNHDHIAQIVHHASTLELPIVWFVDATPTEIIRIVIVYVCDDVIDDYLELLSLISIKYLGWVYASEDLPLFSDAVLGFCADQHTLKLTLNLWRAAFDLFQSRGNEPFPPIKKINPALTTSWNRTKGGVDVDTRNKSDNEANYQHLGVEPRLWDLLIIEAAINTAKIYKWCNLENNLEGIKTVDALMHRFNSSSIHDILIEISAVFRERAEAGQHLGNDHTSSSSASSASLSSSATPSKWTQEYFASRQGILQRTKNIDHIFSFDFKESRPCSDCGTRTKYYCPHCNNVRLCVIHHKDAATADGLTCYQRFHNPDNMTLQHRKVHRTDELYDEEAQAMEEQAPPTSSSSEIRYANALQPQSNQQSQASGTGANLTPGNSGTKRSSSCANDSSDTMFTSNKKTC